MKGVEGKCKNIGGGVGGIDMGGGSSGSCSGGPAQGAHDRRRGLMMGAGGLLYQLRIVTEINQQYFRTTAGERQIDRY